MIKACKDYYTAWKTFGEAFKHQAKSELLKSLHDRLTIEKNYEELDESELKAAKEILESVQNKYNEDRTRLLILIFPFVLFLAFLYGTISILLEILNIVFS